jgi:pyrimidine operon attenuation protein/uracil phosphoribosyltransferase
MNEVLFTASEIEDAIDRMATAMKAGEVYLIGIQRGGARVADALQERLKHEGCMVHRGDLDISFYRDDLSTIGPNPEVHPSHIPFDLDDKHIWLIDDVIYTGRTIRAALGEIFDYGRPASIKLAVLLDRGGRELPIAATVTGLYHALPPDVSVKLAWDDPGWRIEQYRVRT